MTEQGERLLSRGPGEQQRVGQVTANTIRCPKCGGDVYAPSISGVCMKCSLLVFPNGETMPASVQAALASADNIRRFQEALEWYASRDRTAGDWERDRGIRARLALMDVKQPGPGRSPAQ